MVSAASGAVGSVVGQLARECAVLGATIRLRIDPEHVHVFSQADGRRLSESYAR